MPAPKDQPPEGGSRLHQKRASILAAASRVFSVEGYERASMDQIAEAADASKRTLYNHFPSKDALFQAVLAQFGADTQTLKRVPYDPEASLEAQLDQFAEAMVELTRNATWLGLMKVIATKQELVDEAMARVHEEEDTLATWISAANADGRLRVDDPALVASAFWAMLSGAFVMPALFAQPLPSAAIAPLKRELIGMFLARYAT